MIIGDRRLSLPLRNMRWASKWQPGNAENDVEIDSVGQALKPGYVVWVSRETRTVGRYRDWSLPDTKNPAWIVSDDQHEWDAAHTDIVRLEQVPHPQATIFTADHHNAYVVAMVGGYDYDRSVFNRRRPGLPPARLDLQADLLLARPRSGLRLRHRPQRRADEDHRSGHRRGVDADQPGRDHGRRRHARVRAGVLEEHPVRRSVPAARREQRRGVGATARLHDQDLRGRRPRARGLVQQARRDDPRVHRVRAQRRVVAAPAGQGEELGLRPADPRSRGQHRRGQHAARRSGAARGRPLRSVRRASAGSRRRRRSRHAPAT